MESSRNPQQEQMAHPSMVRCLACQAAAVWPLETPLFDDVQPTRILDVACGSGEIVARLAARFPRAEVVGVDLEPSLLTHAADGCADFGPRIRLLRGDAFELPFGDDSFDLVVCRHFLQAVPEPMRVVDELIRVGEPGGRLHLLAEDYGMIHFPCRDGLDFDRFWHEGAIAYGRATHTDLRIGRHLPALLRSRYGVSPRVETLVVDTLNTSRETLLGIWNAWREGYTTPLAEKTSLTEEEVATCWDGMIAVLNDPDAYATWHIPVILCDVPG